MYDDVLDEEMRRFYVEASETLSLLPEIRLMRAYAARACAAGDLKTVITMVDAVMKLVRLQFQNTGDESELNAMINRIAEEIRLEQAGETEPAQPMDPGRAGDPSLETEPELLPPPIPFLGGPADATEWDPESD
jgi:hypothetical protein